MFGIIFPNQSENIVVVYLYRYPDDNGALKLMRRPIENISVLQEKINSLQLENQLLKNILDRSGISYVQELRSLLDIDEVSEYDPNQGARIRWPQYLTNEMTDLVFTRFQGRLDVYAKRFEKKNGESGYSPQCFNFWKEFCPRNLKWMIA